MTIRPFFHLAPPPGVFKDLTSATIYARRFWDALHALRLGKMECTGEITLTANAATTVLNRIGLSPQSVVHFDPKTPNAVAELYGGTMLVHTIDRINDAWTITHANNAQTDRTFQYTAIG